MKAVSVKLESISNDFAFYQVDLPIQQSYLWYGSSDGGLDSQVLKCCSWIRTDCIIESKLVQWLLACALYSLFCSLLVHTFSGLMVLLQQLFQDQ